MTTELETFLSDVGDRKPTIPEVLPFVKAFAQAPGNAVGGSLHIVLDDGNVDDESVKFCEGYAREKGDTFGVLIAQLLMRMSKAQRRKLGAMYCDLLAGKAQKQK